LKRRKVKRLEGTSKSRKVGKLEGGKEAGRWKGSLKRRRKPEKEG
jgi:hypothetical protein